MDTFGKLLFFDEQQQPESINSVVFRETLSLTMETMLDISLNNVTNRYPNDSTHYPSLTSIIYTFISGFICAILCVLTIMGNLLVLVTFRRMQTVGNLFILSLATADLIVGCFVMPLASIYAIMEKWNMGLVLCKIWISVDFTASTASIFNLLTLSLDRYWSITSPLQYLGKRTRTRALLLIGFAWGLSLLWIIPIFGWQYFDSSNGPLERGNCEPEYTHSKVFKVSTAIINFYLPLLVLICLNGRIYYEIKRRYKNVLLQRHSTKLNDPLTVMNNNYNSLYNRRLNQTNNVSRSPITMTLCESDRQLCSSQINCTENENVMMSRVSPKSPRNNTESALRINFKEKKPRPPVPMQIADGGKSSLKRTYSYIDTNHCTQDELTWFARRREQTHSSRSQTSPIMVSNYDYKRSTSRLTQAKDHCSENTNKYSSYRSYSTKQKLKRNISNSSLSYKHHHQYQTSFCRRCSLLDLMNTSPPPSAPATMNIFNLCHCCSTATSAITIHSNQFINNNHNYNRSVNSNIESHSLKRKMSSSSSSSVTPALINRKQQQSPRSFYGINHTNSLSRSNSPNNQPSPISNKVKQSTVWNQQEKAFRQLFAIVFGFTCCFLPYFILYMVVAFCGSCVSERVLTATIWLGYVNSTINPFLYALSNKHFRRTFNRLIKRDNRRPLYYN